MDTIWVVESTIRIVEIFIGDPRQEPRSSFPAERVFHFFKTEPSIQELALWALQDLEQQYRINKVFPFHLFWHQANKYDGFEFRAHFNFADLFGVPDTDDTSIAEATVKVLKKKAPIEEILPSKIYLTNKYPQTRKLAREIEQKISIPLREELDR